MQTFLPYSDFIKCAQVLDYRRLNKQITEATQILKAIERKQGGWVNHPITKMWWNYSSCLKLYHHVL